MRDKPAFASHASVKAAAMSAKDGSVPTPFEQKGQVYPLDNTLRDEDKTGANESAWDCFFIHLSKTANVAEALKKSGMSAEQVLSERTNDPEKASRWQHALAAGYDELEMELLYRARFGTEKTVYYAGKKIDTTREYDNGIALRLLGQHRASQVARQTDAIKDENAVDILRERLLAYRRKVAQALDDPCNDEESKGPS